MRETRNNLRVEIARYLEELPESYRVFHNAMKYLEILAMGVIVIVFLVALYFSFTWKSVTPTTVALAWFTFAASGCLIIMLNGVHSAFLRAFPVSILPSNASKLITGASAKWIGFGMIIGGLVYAAFWGMMAYGTATANYELLRPLITLLGTVLGFVIAVSIIIKMVSTILKKLP